MIVRDDAGAKSCMANWLKDFGLRSGEFYPSKSYTCIKVDMIIRNDANSDISFDLLAACLTGRQGRPKRP